MFNDYDVVIAVKDLSSKVRKGSIGAVLMCFDNDDYEVEFVNSKGESLEVLTVHGTDMVLKEEAADPN